jgi:SAM-dependent methyltransferase
MIDWGLGHYEHTAAELEPVADHVVSLAAPRSGERALDLATGTGNAALLAAGRGAVVTGLDAAPRLVEVARARAERDGVAASFVVGDLGSLPFEDGAFDVALSVFGVIFAPDPARAFAEMVRVLAPHGRAVFSAWVPDGPIDAMVGTIGRAMAGVTGQTPRRFAWHDPAAIGELAAAHGAQARAHDGRLTITAPSPEGYFAANEAHHPMSVAGRPLLERAGRYDEVREQAIAVLRQGNEDPAAFRVSSPYRIFEIRRT